MTPLPAHLPPLPDLPSSYHWEYRGMGWRTVSPRYYAFFMLGRDGKWEVMPMAACASGVPQTHYIERVITRANPSLTTTDPFEAEGHV